MAEVLPPGSDVARAAGCKCPVLDNGYGKGYMGVAGVYVRSSMCPLHWTEADNEPADLASLEDQPR